MSTYKEQIKQRLNADGWQIIAISSTGLWWDDEYWKMGRSKNEVDLVLYIHFIVDPMFEGDRKKGQGIYAVNASTALLQDWNDRNTSVATLSMSKRKFAPKLDAFISTINTYTRTELSKVSK